MAVLLPSKIRMIEWFEQRIPVWTTNPTAIGLTMGQVTQLLSRTAAARSAYQNAQAARNESRSKAVLFHDATGNLRDYGADLIKTIKAYAETTEDPSVYAEADVPPPAQPSPLGPPGTPTDIVTTINNRGYVEIRWKADNAANSSGAYFRIERRLSDEQAFRLLGTTGHKTFTDETIPVGTHQATYIITPCRGDASGEPSEQFVVPFAAQAGQQAAHQNGHQGLSLAA
ncbi:MAG TPA: hypothetical protein PLU35_07320 [Phycisphaerales bacterium]|nr:hypothetical protein [Phycisphaerales bacterium]